VKAHKEKRAIAEKLKQFFYLLFTIQRLKKFSVSESCFIGVESVAQPQKSEVVSK